MTGSIKKIIANVISVFKPEPAPVVGSAEAAGPGYRTPLGENYKRLLVSNTNDYLIALKEPSIRKYDNTYININLVPGIAEIRVEQMKILYEFAHFTSPSGYIRNLLNWTLFSDEGASNPTYLAFRLQFELNKALKKIGQEEIGVDGYFGVGSAKALQTVIKYYLPDELKDELVINGKIVSEQSTSLALVFVLPLLEVHHSTFVDSLIHTIETYGSIMQHGAFPIGKYPSDHPTKAGLSVVDV